MLTLELNDPWVNDQELYQLFEECMHNLSTDGVEYHAVRDNLDTVTIYARCAPNKNADVLKKLAEVIELMTETQELRSGIDTGDTPVRRPAMRAPQRVGSSTMPAKRRDPRLAGSPPIESGRTSPPSAKPTWGHSGYLPL